MKYVILTILLISCLWAGIVPDTWYDVLEFKPIKYGIMDNRHLPGHVFWVASGTSFTRRVTIPVLAGFGYELRPETVEKWVTYGMVCFEGYQLIENNFEPAKVYGSNERWFWDSVGDVVAPWWVMRKILYADKPLITFGKYTVEGLWGWEGALAIEINWRF